jgi:hypothetical protein
MKRVNFIAKASATADRYPMVTIAPLSKYSKGFTVSAVFRASMTFPTYVPSCLAWLGHAGDFVQRDHVADGEHLGSAREGAVRLRRHPAGQVGLDAGGAGQHPHSGEASRPSPAV